MTIQRFESIATIVLRVVEAAALVTLMTVAFHVNKAIDQITASVHSVQVTADALPDKVLSEVDAQMKGVNQQLSTTNNTLDKQLTAFNGNLNNQLGLIRQDLDHQASALNSQINGTLVPLNNLVSDINLTTLPQVNSVVQHVDTIAANPDIPKLVRDTRETMAFAGQTMRHVETTADAVAKAAPGTTQAVEGIAVDTHKLTTAITAPKPWYKKVFDILFTTGELKSLF